MWYDKYVEELEATERKYAFSNNNDVKPNKTSVKDILAKLRQPTTEQSIVGKNIPVNPADDDDIAIALLYRENFQGAVTFCGKVVSDLGG